MASDGWLYQVRVTPMEENHYLRDPNAPLPTGSRQFLWHLLKPDWLILLLATILTAPLALIGMLIAACLGPSLQVLMTGTKQPHSMNSLLGDTLGPLASSMFGLQTVTSQDLLTYLPGTIVALALFKCTLSASLAYIWELASERLSCRLRGLIFERFLQIPLVARLSPKAQEGDAHLSTALGNDVKCIRECVVRYYGSMPRECLQAFFYIGLLLSLSPKLSVLFFFLVLPGMALINRLGKRLKKRSQRALEDFADVAEWLQQRMLGFETIKHAMTEPLEEEKFTKQANLLYQRFLKAARTKALASPLIEGASVVAIAYVLYTALSDILTSNLSGTVLMSFFSALGFLSQSGGKIARCYASQKEGFAASDRCLHLLRGFSSHTLSQGDQVSIGHMHEPLIYKDVSIRYDGTTSPAVSNFSATFHRGKTYCIVGPSGVGKSSLLHAAVGIVPFTGQIIVSTNPAKIPIQFVPQQCGLLGETLGECIAFPDRDRDDAKARFALSGVGMDYLFSRWPEGLDKDLMSTPHGLSGGEMQRLHLARVLYHQSELIVIDEGTSALDESHEHLVLQSLNILKENGSCIVMVAHRRAPEQWADEVIKLTGYQNQHSG